MARLAFLLALLASCAGAQQGLIKTLIFSGHNNHDWRVTTPFLKDVLTGSGRFDVRVIEEPAGITDRTLAGYELVVLDFNGPRWGAATEAALDSFVRSGKGLVGVHGAGYAFAGLQVLGDRHVGTGVIEPAWPEFFAMLGGRWSEGPPKTGHGQRHSFRVRFTDRSHPIAAGQDEAFIATDELYHKMQMHPGAKVLAVAFDDPKRGGTGKEEPILWTVDYGKGRVFMDQLGHDLTALAEPGFIRSFLRGAEWAARGSIAAEAQRPKPMRLLVVTGGHSYDSSFYSLFEGYPDIQWVHATSDVEAYKQDIRPDYDVLVLYDLHKDLGEPQRTNLRNFVEGSKGLIVVHHAIANYNGWKWWWQEVVGGRYLLAADGDQPASTYKHDVEVVAEPVGRNPISSSVGPLHFKDEGYRKVWISPKVNIILTTSNSEWDGPLAWISPYWKSRVVYIQLGHDQYAHRNPGYRNLVRNAIVWAGRRD